jgi:hypothetical protein
MVVDTMMTSRRSKSDRVADDASGRSRLMMIASFSIYESVTDGRLGL